MSAAEKEALFQAVINQTEGYIDLVNAAWPCLDADDILRIEVLLP